MHFCFVFHTGVGKQRHIVDVTSVARTLGRDHCKALMGLYCFTGEDCTSAFKGKGKIGPLKKLQKYPRFQTAFKQLSVYWRVKDKLYDCLQEFVCLTYGYPHISSVDEVRTPMLQKMAGAEETLTFKSKVELSHPPPCRDSLIPHVDRVNYRVGQWEHAHVPMYELPKPEDDGWMKMDGFLEPVWSRGPILPPPPFPGGPLGHP